MNGFEHAAVSRGKVLTFGLRKRVSRKRASLAAEGTVREVHDEKTSRAKNVSHEATEMREETPTRVLSFSAADFQNT